MSPLEQTIRHHTPVLVMKGTGRVADLISDLRCVYRRGVNHVEPEDLYVANGPQLCDEDIDPLMLRRFVLVKRVAQDIQGGTVDGGHNQILQLNDRWKSLFLEYLFKGQKELKEQKEEEHLCQIANELTYVMRNMGRLFIHDIKNVSRADGEMEGVTLMDAVAQCVYVEMRRKGHASTCFMLWRQLEKTGRLVEEVEDSKPVITKRMQEIHAIIERSFRKDELLLLIKVDSKMT